MEKEITEKWVSKDDNVPQEVVRFEVTLKKKLAVRQKMQRLGYIKKEYTLSDVFKESVWTGILTGEIAKVFNCQIPKFTYFAQCSSEKINKVIDELEVRKNKLIEIRLDYEDVKDVAYDAKFKHAIESAILDVEKYISNGKKFLAEAVSA